MINKKSTIDYSEHPLTKNFLNNIMSQGGEAAGVYTLKNDEKRVVRVVHALNAEMAEGGIYDLLVDIGKSEHWPSRALKTESIEVVHGNFSEDLKAAQLQVQQRGYGSHDLADFKLASKEQVGQLIKDISTLDRLGINFDAKPRNILFDKEIGFQLLDLIPKTLYTNAQEAMERNSTKDANHLKRILGIAQSLLGNTFSNKELLEAVKSINSNKPIIGSSTPAASVVQPTITATAVPVATTSTQAQAPINSTRPLKDRILSFDIETSSLEPRSGFVWQSGFASFGSSPEGMYFHPNDTSDVSEIESRLTTSKFGKEQHKAGAFNEYLKGSASNQDGFVRTLADKLISENKAGKDILLIQNANFERRWIEAAGSASEIGQQALSDLSSVFGYSYKNRQTLLNMPAIYPSPEILELRNKSLNDYYKFLKNGDESLFKSAASAYEGIMTSYDTMFADTSGKLKVVDMMDITRGVLFKAAEQGHIPKNMALIGTSQDFLSRMMFGTPESHLAPDDAHKALQIAFDKLLPLYKNLSGGTLSSDDLKLLGDIRQNQPQEAAKQFGRSIIRAVEEGQSQYGYRVLSAHGMSNPEEISFTNNVTGQVEQGTREYRVARYHISAENGLDEILRDVSERFNGVDMGGRTSESIIDEVLNRGTYAEKIAEAERVGDILKTDPSKLISNVKQESSNKIFEWVKNNKAKTAVGVAAGIGIASIAFSSDKDAETLRAERKARKQLSNAIDPNLRLYATPNIQPAHGSGFADWNERTKHHYY